MAIFSLRHAWLGKSHSDYKPSMGMAHANYITRESSCTKILGRRAPVERQAIKGWIDREELADRKNARIVDKLVVALPIELTPSQREALLADFCEKATHGRASWVAAIHDRGKDAHNPHAHIMFRDRDYQSGRRVMMTTERGSTERFRQLWEEAANRALERAGLDIRIDRRTLAAQGVDRTPDMHRGPSKDRQRGALPTHADPFSRPRADDDRKKRTIAPRRDGFDWTGRGSMVAQQWSALKWSRKANEKLQESSVFDSAPKIEPNPSLSTPKSRGVER